MRIRSFARSTFAYWAAAGLLALATAAFVARSTGTAREMAVAYGAMRVVVLPERTLELGTVVDDGDVAEREVPGALVPPEAPYSKAEVVGRTVVVPAVAGLPIVAAHLSSGKAPGLSALVPPGARAVAVPRGDSSTPVVRGDRVDVLATLDPSAAPELEPTFAVARAALVVDVTESSATVAVSVEESKRVAYAVAQGVVTLAVAPPGEPSDAEDAAA